MKHNAQTRDGAMTETSDVLMTARNDGFERDEADTTSHRLNRKPSRIFDALTVSPRLSRAWVVVSCVCLAIAAACFWFERIDAAFVAAVLGVVAWFMNLRGRFYRAANEKEISHR